MCTAGAILLTLVNPNPLGPVDKAIDCRNALALALAVAIAVELALDCMNACGLGLGLALAIRAGCGLGFGLGLVKILFTDGGLATALADVIPLGLLIPPPNWPPLSVPLTIGFELERACPT